MTDGRPTILVVDDDASILKLIARALERDYDLLTATDGGQAVDTFRLGEDAIDLVLLDLGMPGMGGYEALAELQLIDADVRVVVITGLEADPDRLPGVAHILTKPFRPDGLLEVVARVLGR